MKILIYIIIALGMCIASYGQDDEGELTPIGVATKYIGDLPTGDSLESWHVVYDEKYDHVRYEIALREEYEAECYADSTETTYDWYNINGDTIAKSVEIDPGFYMGYIGTWSIWTHRTPLFESYTQWLKEKLKDLVEYY